MSPLPPDFRFALVNTSTRYGQAPAFSVLAHVAIFASLLLFLTSERRGASLTQPKLFRGLEHRLLRYTPPPEWNGRKASLGFDGRGGAEEPEPARLGPLAPRSSMPLAPPRLTHTEHVELPAPPAVADPNAPLDVQLVTDLGLPWMKKDTNSGGPEKGHGIGNRGGNGMGDDDGDSAGEADDSLPYANVRSPAACRYCPEPPYSDDARRAKLQGLVTVRVLIGSDGRAKRIQLVKGLGMGLDESAVEAIRNWRFQPAHDARRQAIASWATIETRFQLF